MPKKTAAAAKPTRQLIDATPAEAPQSTASQALKSRIKSFLMLYDEIEALKVAHTARLKLLQEKYDAAHADLLGDMNVAGLSYLKGPETNNRPIKKDIKEVATIDDFDAVWGYMKENDVPELLQKRLASTVVKERQEQGEIIPGVGKFVRVELKVGR